jgi:hypothetical protein
MMTAIHRTQEQHSDSHDWEGEARRSFDWVEAHHDELRGYTGQWIAVANEQVIAHGTDGAVVMRQARERGYARALCLFIYPDDVAFA